MRGSPFASWAGSDIPAVWALIIIKFVFFAVQSLFPGVDVFSLLAWMISPAWLTHVEPWQCVTYSFVHGGFLDLLFDLLVLIFFGSVLERAWGSLRFVGFYFMCGIVSGLVVLGLTFLGLPPGMFISQTATFVGLGVAYGAMNPYAQVYLFFVLPIQARWLGLASAVLELLLKNGAYGGPLSALISISVCCLFAWTFTRGISWRPRGGGGGPSLRERFERWRQRQRMRAWQRKVSKIDKPEDLFK